MADKRTTPEPGAGRRKRAAPTIDLKATEVPATEVPAAAATREPPRASAEQPKAAAAPPQSPPPPSGGGPSVSDPWHWLSTNMTGPSLASGLAGATLVAVLMFALWLTGAVPIRYAGSTATRARVTALEIEVQALQNRPAGAVDTKAFDGLSERIGKIEHKIEQSIATVPAGDPGMAEKITAADNAVKALAASVATLNRRSDDIATGTAQARERAEAAEKAVAELRSSVQIASTATAGLSSADMDAMQKRIAGLEQSTKAARDELNLARSDMARTGSADIAVRLAVSASVLQDVVLRGSPFAAALAQAKALGADQNALAPLLAFTTTGLPTRAALSKELQPMLAGQQELWDVKQPAAGGFIERLLANAGNLVRVRPVDAPPGNDIAAVLARLEVAAARNDIPAVLADIGRLERPDLTDQERAPLTIWIVKAKAREAAAAAAQAFAADTARALGAK